MRDSTRDFTMHLTLVKDPHLVLGRWRDSNANNKRVALQTDKTLHLTTSRYMTWVVYQLGHTLTSSHPR